MKETKQEREVSKALLRQHIKHCLSQKDLVHPVDRPHVLAAYRNYRDQLLALESQD